MAIETIQACLDIFRKPRYLEIGVQDGHTFHGVVADSKIAVDPTFRFDVRKARAQNPNAEYHAVPSDKFFSGYDKAAFDVVFIDGLHTAEQTLRDLLNAVSHTRPNSLIIVDDVFPDSYASSLPDEPLAFRLKKVLNDPGPAWMGDVYKLVFFIETFMQQYSFATPITGNPQLVLWRGARSDIPARTLSDIAFADFAQIQLEQGRLRRHSLASVIAAARLAGAGD
jgi:hypothetical protein